MKVKDHKDYNDEFPENFTWGWVDSLSLGNVSEVIVNYIKNDLKYSKDRNMVPGLRLALRILAGVAEV